MSYAVFLVVAGCVMLIGVYIILRYIPDYPPRAAIPNDFDRTAIATRQETLNALIGVSGFILAGLAIVGIVGGWILAGWILRPLQRINDAALIAATGRLDHRIRLHGRNDEFRQVADSFNHMLDRLQDAFAAQERFAANASHELRTPLAITETLLDVALANPSQQNYGELLDRLSLTNARAIGITEALLRLADANAVTAVAEPVDLAAIVSDAMNENSVEAAQRQVTFQSRLMAAPTVGDPTLLLQLATNLIQNAIRHNHTPGTAWIETFHDLRLATVTLHIANSGARYTSETAALLCEPFLRGRGRINQPGEPRGHGLGLTLVSRVVEIHGGTMTITPNEASGLVIVVTLPDDT